MEVVVTEDKPDQLVAAVLSGDVDLELVYKYDLVSQHWPSGLIAKELLREDLILLVPASSEIHDLEQFKASDMANQTWIASLESTAESFGASRLWSIWDFEPDVVLRTDNYDLIRELVGRGRGVGVVPSLGYVRDDAVRGILVSGEASYRRVFAIYRNRNTNPFLADAIATLSASVQAEGSGSEG